MSDKSLLRFITCGSVDDGKSTLIGRLLFDSKQIMDDQMGTLESDSRKFGTTGEDIDFALLVDGLESEREQGITIDVAYRYFATKNRKFIVADTPGHEQYTRNMATGASTADAAIVLIDARKGVITQTKRHTHIAALLGIKHIVVAVNKMDLMDFKQDVFDDIANDYNNFVQDMGFGSVTTIPLSARYGDNVTNASDQMKWYDGMALLPFLESIEIDASKTDAPLRFPVQSVNRPDLNHRSYRGTIVSGALHVGMDMFDVKTGQSAKIDKILFPDGRGENVSCRDAVDISLDTEIDISRGHVLSTRTDAPKLSSQFQAHIIWFDIDPMLPGRSYVLQTVNNDTRATITSIKHKIDINNLGHSDTKSLSMNDIGVCNLSTQQSIAMDAYKDIRQTGAFILVDPVSNRTVGAGMIDFSLYRADNIQWQNIEITPEKRAEIKHQKPLVLWCTGLSGSGKSTIANALEQSLHAQGKHTYILDGDNVRHGLNKDLGFTDADRVENIRRVAEVAKLMADAGLIVIASFIAPFAADRKMARDLIPVEECIKRDPKGLYKKALVGEIPNFPGVNSPYEDPQSPDIHIRNHNIKIADAVSMIEEKLNS
jgi:bifunctional enzyme CysN/CysC